MTTQDLARVYDAVSFADHYGTPLTAFLTINWRSAPGFDGSDAHSWATHHTRLMKSMQSWLATRCIPFALAYVRERVVGIGGHTHFLVHLPTKEWRSTASALQGHLHSAGGFTEPRAVHVQQARTPGMVTVDQRVGLVRYLAKGINPHEVIWLPGTGAVSLPTFLSIRPEPQAALPAGLKRVGCSENIGPTARKRAGYKDAEDILRLADCLPADPAAT